jgi:hypothetical protein
VSEIQHFIRRADRDNTNLAEDFISIGYELMTVSRLSEGGQTPGSTILKGDLS